MSDPIPAPDAASALNRERRLEEIRREAEEGRLRIVGQRPAGAPFPQASPENGYYGFLC